jgi:indole-3-glycerol phosphate synthase
MEGVFRVTILDRILTEKRKEVDSARRLRSQAFLEKGIEKSSAPRELFRDPSSRYRTKGPLVIAEMKRKSPSRGLIRNPYDPLDLASRYYNSGAGALSILTDGPFFGGSLKDLETVRKSPVGERIPILRKDFVIDPYQVYESRWAGADLVLLIVRILPQDLLENLLRLTRFLGMTALVETHQEEEVMRALESGADLVGVNHRDLDTLDIDLDRGERLAKMIPDNVRKVAESGMKVSADYRRMQSLGFDGVLVGESFLTSSDPGRALEEFCGTLD